MAIKMINNLLLLHAPVEYAKLNVVLYDNSQRIASVLALKHRAKFFSYPADFVLGTASNKIIRNFIRTNPLVLDFKLNSDRPISPGSVKLCIPGKEVEDMEYLESLNSEVVTTKYDLIIASSQQRFLALNKIIKNNTKIVLCNDMFTPGSKGETRFLKIVQIFSANGKSEILNSFIKLGTSDTDLIKYALNHGYFSLLTLFKRGLLKRKVDKFKNSSLRSSILEGFKWLFQFFPVEKKTVVFRTFQQEYCCNPKYITEELISRKTDAKIVWIANYKKIDFTCFPSNVKIVDQNSIGAWYYMNTGRVLVDNNVRKTMPIKKRGQVHIQTWHGSLGLKKFTDVWSKKTQDLANRDTDLLISNSTFETNVFRESVWPDTPVKEWGHPRNDILFCKNQVKVVKDKVYKRYNLSNDVSLILYAPTFRDEHLYGTTTQKKDLSMYLHDFDSLIAACTERFGKKFVVLTRMHPHISKRLELAQDPRVINVSSYPDIQELILLSDIAITDYSSWIFDFLLTKRPGFIYAVDHKAYLKQREIYYPLDSLPFPFADSFEKLLSSIKSFDQDKFNIQASEFLEKAHCVEDGKASIRVVDYIIDSIDKPLK